VLLVAPDLKHSKPRWLVRERWETAAPPVRSKQPAMNPIP
jgi:hypothetical protein